MEYRPGPASVLLHSPQRVADSTLSSSWCVTQCRTKTENSTGYPVRRSQRDYTNHTIRVTSSKANPTRFLSPQNQQSSKIPIMWLVRSKQRTESTDARVESNVAQLPTNVRSATRRRRPCLERLPFLNVHRPVRLASSFNCSSKSSSHLVRESEIDK